MARTTRADIVAAARDLMRDKGYAGTSMKDVADRVGLLKGSLYSHFSGKEALVPAVLDLTFREVVEDIPPTGDWRADYGRALERLTGMLTRNRRCIGMHLAYGLGDSAPALREAVAVFFRDLRDFLGDLIVQGVDEAPARDLARDTLTAIEGATLWLALDGTADPLERARAELLARADALALDPPDAKVRALLDGMLGDWRRAGQAERQLAERVVAAEDALLMRDARHAAVAEGESCFR